MVPDIYGFVCAILGFLIYFVHPSNQINKPDGYLINPMEYPSFLGIHVYEEGRNYRFCGATIIYPMFIMTIKKCVKTKDATPRLDIFAGISMNETKRLHSQDIVEKYHFHKKLDVAILELKETFGSLYDFRPIPMPDRNDINKGLSAFKGTGTFCGFGENDQSHSPNNLSYINLRITEPEDCDRSEIHLFRFCAVAPDNPINYKRGPRWIDNGGPFVFDDKDMQGEIQERKMMGIFEYNAPRTLISTFLFVPNFMDWVEDVTGHKVWEN